jgi:hypothetical protein
MEYFLGSAITLGILLISLRVINRGRFVSKIQPPKSSQSRSFSLIAPFFVNNSFFQSDSFEIPETQSRKHLDSSGVRLVIYNNNAYWIYENIFYTAKVFNGTVDKETTKTVDTMGMSTVELKELSEIVDRLREGTGNDSSNSGNQKF